MFNSEINSENTGGVFDRLNDEQQNAVISKKTTVVSAGAGSGKTTVLALRYAYLVTIKKIKVEEILTLTFTKKAAAEMRARIYQTLFTIAQKGKGEEQMLASAAIANFANAKIQTLDSFCSYIVHDSANRCGIRPDFVVDDSGAEEIAHSAALPFILSHKQHPALKELFKFKNPNAIEQLFIEASQSYANLCQKLSFNETVHTQANIITENWDGASETIKEQMREFVLSFEDDSATPQKYREKMEPYIKTAADFLTAGVYVDKKDIEKYFGEIIFADAQTRIQICQNHPLRTRIISFLRITENIAYINLNSGPKDHSAKVCVKQIRRTYPTFSSLVVFCLQAGLLFSLTELIDEFLLELIPQKRLKGALTFDDISLLAVDLLLNNPEIRNAEKKNYKAIMIDEFQDNNTHQKNLLYLLAEDLHKCSPAIPETSDIVPGKLFFVGDEKQSIYRFRDADVSVFRKLCGELADKKHADFGVELNLNTNYRSSTKLIDSFNALCTTIFAPDTALPDYEARFIPLKPFAGNESKNTPAQPVTVSILDTKNANSANKNNDLLDADEIEAFHTAKRIYSLITDENIAPHDIAILFRTGTKLHFYERYLRRFGIQYTSENHVSFFADAPVNDIYALLRLVSYPRDRYSYAVLLRSPFVNLSFQDFSLCMLNRTDEPFSDAERAALSDTARKLFDKGKILYDDLSEKSKTFLCAEIITHIWYNYGYRFETLWNKNVMAYNELYDYLFELACREDAKGGSLASFVAELQKIKKNEKKLEDMDIPLERKNAVHLLTIHKSKGLEFPVVFIPSCGNRGKNQGIDGELYKTDFGPSCNIPLPLELLSLKDVKKNYFYELARTEENNKQTAELRRLLYVGMTRAESRLYLSGHIPLSENSGQTLYEVLNETVDAKYKYLMREEKPGVIDGDKVLPDNTLLGLLLPAICTLHENATQLEEIEPVTREDVHTIMRQVKSNEITRITDSGRHKKIFLEAAASLYENASIITTPVIKPNKTSPTSAAVYDMFTKTAQQKTVLKYNTVQMVKDKTALESVLTAVIAVDEIISIYAETPPDKRFFSAADFGTIAHAAVQSCIAKTKLIIPPQLDSLVTPEHSNILAQNAIVLANIFLTTELGKAAETAAKSGWLKSEYEFITRVPRSQGKGFFIGGVIDLLFENAQGVTVIDFKTDKDILPEKHIPQLACYYRAAKDMRKKPVRVWIYYLRSGTAIDLTEEVIKSDAEFSSSSVSLSGVLA